MNTKNEVVFLWSGLILDYINFIQNIYFYLFKEILNKLSYLDNIKYTSFIANDIKYTLFITNDRRFFNVQSDIFSCLLFIFTENESENR